MAPGRQPQREEFPSSRRRATCQGGRHLLANHAIRVSEAPSGATRPTYPPSAKATSSPIWTTTSGIAMREDTPRQSRSQAGSCRVLSYAHLTDSAGAVGSRHGHLPRDPDRHWSGCGALSQGARPRRRRDGASGSLHLTDLPPYLRRTKSIEELLPWLYLKGISTGLEALAALLVAGARLDSMARLQRRDLSAKRGPTSQARDKPNYGRSIRLPGGPWRGAARSTPAWRPELAKGRSVSGKPREVTGLLGAQAVLTSAVQPTPTSSSEALGPIRVACLAIRGYPGSWSEWPQTALNTPDLPTEPLRLDNTCP